MPPYIEFDAGGSLFTPKRQSPTAHVKALRHPSAAVSNSTPFLSPGLHNVPDVWVRYLRSKAHQFVDEFGEGRNQRLLLGKSVQERKEIQKWSKNVKKDARTFILGIYDDQVATKREEYFKRLLEQALLAAIENFLAKYKDEDEEVACRVEDWSAGFEESDEQVNCAIENWLAKFGGSDEQVELTIQSEVEKDAGAPIATLHPSSSCSSLSTEYDPIFDSDEGSSSDEDMGSYYAYPSDAYSINAYPNYWNYTGYPMGHNGCENSLRGQYMTGQFDTAMSDSSSNRQDSLPASAPNVDLTGGEYVREEPMTNAESLLASAWHHWRGHGYQLMTCSWLPIKSQAGPEIVKAGDDASQVPCIQLTTPEGQVCNLIERQAILHIDIDEYAADREASQPRMIESLEKYRALNETYSQYCTRVDGEMVGRQTNGDCSRDRFGELKDNGLDSLMVAFAMSWK